VNIYIGDESHGEQNKMTTKQMKCTCCSTAKKPVYITPVKVDGWMECPHCGSIELEVRK
jgi:Zn finger protein HypA/HybF involved in hydrogenase expression